MRQGLHKFFSALAGGGLLWASLPMAYAYADPAPEHALKAAFIYNFATFTEWPVKIADKLNLCILGNDPLGNALIGLEGKPVGNARLASKYVNGSSDGMRDCHMLFISASEKDNLPAILDTVRESGTLTIADLPGVARQGVMIALTLEQKKITFEINLEAARQGKLNISSKLLRLAKTVY